MTTKRSTDDYSDYRATLLEGGVSEAEADQAVARLLETAVLLDKRVCPTCGKRLTRNEDLRQCGPSAKEGMWINYRCDCGFMWDRVEKST